MHFFYLVFNILCLKTCRLLMLNKSKFGKLTENHVLVFFKIMSSLKSLFIFISPITFVILFAQTRQVTHRRGVAAYVKDLKYLP